LAAHADVATRAMRKVARYIFDSWLTPRRRAPADPGAH
jgi:hypothetical protein